MPKSNPAGFSPRRDLCRLAEP